MCMCINLYLLLYPSVTHVSALSQFLLHIFLLSPAELAWSQEEEAQCLGHPDPQTWHLWTIWSGAMWKAWSTICLWILNSSYWPEYSVHVTWSVRHLDYLKGHATISFVDVMNSLKMAGANANIYCSRCLKSLEGIICLCMLFDIEAPSLNGMILNAALALLFYICGHGFLLESSSIRSPQYAPEVLHQTLGTLCTG
jgi:hypothetical protein